MTPLQKNIFRALCYYILPLAMFVTLYAPIFTPAQKFHFAIEFGLWGIRLLALMLFAKPLFVLFPKRLRFLSVIVGNRKKLGLLCFWMVFFHGTYLFVAEGLMDSPEIVLDPFTFFFWGALAFIGMVILAITSNKFSQNKLGHKKWKRVHWIVYPTFGLACIHFAMAKNEFTPLLLFAAYVVLKGCEWHKKHSHNKKYHS